MFFFLKNKSKFSTYLCFLFWNIGSPLVLYDSNLNKTTQDFGNILKNE